MSDVARWRKVFFRCYARHNYAEQFGWTELGAVAAGRRADLVVLDRDPTLDAANADRIDAVFLAGVQVDREALLKPSSSR
jgi:adenine deaminase